VYPKFRASHVLAALITIVPFAYLVRMVMLRYVDVPLWDSWEMVPRLQHMYSGSLTFTDFWGQHNEHRPFVPVAILLLLARLSDWDMRWEAALNLVLSVGIFSVYVAYLRTAWRERGGAPVWMVPVLSLLLFSPVQWENFLWGWQAQLLLCALVTALGSYLISRRTLGGAIACGVCASYSFGSGLFFWPSQAVGVWLSGGRHRVRRLAIWIGAGALTFASYLYDFHRPGQPPMLSNFSSLAALRAYTMYVLTQLGNPIGGFDPRVAPVAGAAVLVAFVALVVRLRAFHAESIYLFPLLVGLQTLATSAMSGTGRAWMGVDQAQSSRYTTLTLPIWCAVTALGALWRHTVPETRPVRRRLVTAVTAALVLVMLGTGFKATRPAVGTAAARSDWIRYLRRGLLTGKSDVLLQQIYPVVEVIRARRAVVMRLHLTVFRPSAQPSYPLPGPE
jgi:hypothetical protein